MTINGNELLDALRDAMTDRLAEDGTTIAELVRGMKKGRSNERGVRDAMRILLENGQAECVQVMRPRLNGVMARVFAYRLKP